MPLRNGVHGYGLVTKTLHWATVVALSAQLAVGYLMDVDADADAREARIEIRLELIDDRDDERLEDRLDDRADAIDEADYPSADTVLDDDPAWFDVHVVLGLLLLALAVARLTWRGTTPLPPWSDRLTAADRRVAHATERVLLSALLLAPVTGLVLLVTGDDALLWLHVASHLAIYAGLASHLLLVARRRLLPRML